MHYIKINDGKMFICAEQVTSVSQKEERCVVQMVDGITYYLPNVEAKDIVKIIVSVTEGKVLSV